jgi:hypothetical protein
MITKKRIDRKEKPLYYLMVGSIILYAFQRIFFPVTILNEPLRLFKERYNILRGKQFYEIFKNTEDSFNPNREVSIECREAVLNSYLVDSYEIK